MDEVFSDPAQLSRIKAEAIFGQNELSPILDGLPANARVLEVGCGTGYLLSNLSTKYPHLEFHGLEPIGGGFSSFNQVLEAFTHRYPEIPIHKVPIETFSSEFRYDLMFSVNVFEHLADWRTALMQCMIHLKTEGFLVFLCPNYSFPYEPHFKIPVLGNAKLTYRWFKRKILNLENRYGAEGLWNSLNFINSGDLKRFCRSQNVRLEFDKGITGRMLDRLNSDVEFQSRQKTISIITSVVRKLRLGSCLSHLPLPCLPYMKVLASKGNGWDLQSVPTCNPELVES